MASARKGPSRLVLALASTMLQISPSLHISYQQCRNGAFRFRLRKPSWRRYLMVWQRVALNNCNYVRLNSPMHQVRRLQITKLFDVAPECIVGEASKACQSTQQAPLQTRLLHSTLKSLTRLGSSGFVTTAEGLADLLVLKPSTGLIPRCPAPSI